MFQLHPISLMTVNCVTFRLGTPCADIYLNYEMNLKVKSSNRTVVSG